jgi:tetratricopeptide (TPR) repeat protein
MIKNINGHDYQVLPEEFVFQHHDRYNNLKIIPELAKFERIVSLLREISLSLKINHFIHVLPTHGGFIPIQLSNTIENIFIHSLDIHQLENTFANINHTPNVFISPEIPSSTSLIFFDSSSQPFDDIFSNNIVLYRRSQKPDLISNANEYHLSGTDLWLSLPESLVSPFIKEFHPFIKGDELEYDNLIDLCIMVKNGGDQFETMLRENFHLIDKWTILDTGSTDNTIEIINRVLVGKKRGQLYCEPFINFPDSRNRCLELAGQTCKYTLMLDDTYIVKGNLREFLQVVRGDQFATSYSLYVTSDDVQYTSNRIVKTENKLRYVFKLHEIINPVGNINVSIPADVANIFDYRCDYMEGRTMERKAYDLRVLEEGLRDEPDNPRNLYYLAQTYSLLKKYDVAFDYFIQRVNHPVQGFIQEKHDAYFEAGRIANFQLKKPWNECQELYEKAFAMDNKRPESQYFLGIHYYLEGNYKEAWTYFYRAYQIGFPVHCEFSLKPTLSFFFLPKFLAELCYTYAKNYTLGKQVALFFLQNNQPVSIEYETMKLWYNIFSLLETMHLSLPDVVAVGEKPILTFVADSGSQFGSWSGRDILTRGMGGSETYIIEMARWIQRSGVFRVIVFCRCEEMDIFENVTYLPIVEYTDFICKNRVHSSVISRFTEYIPCSIEGHVENVFLVLHDLVPEGTIIPIHPKLKKVFCLSEWHVDHFLKIFPSFADRTIALYYGVDQPLKIENYVKIPYKFIYSSYPNRGLLSLLEMWSTIIKREPRASLHIYCDVDGKWVNSVVPEEMEKIRRLLSEYGSSDVPMNIFYHGWVPKRVLMESWMTADVWFYPTAFLETFCLTALECAISRTLAITTKLGSLVNVVGDRGILLEGDARSDEWRENAIETLFEVLENKEKKENFIERNYQWAKSLTWETQSKKLLSHLFVGENNVIHYGEL